MTDLITADFFKLKGAIQHYEWGGMRYIPSLLSRTNDANRPHAELWIGTHKKGAAYLQTKEAEVKLCDLIQTAPEAFLGAAAAKKFGGHLPFLLKVLDARKMLSIQVHPSAAQADAGFADEEARGVPFEAPNRNYKDRNHKLEVHVALTDFWMLHSFRTASEIAEMLRKNSTFRPLLEKMEGHIAAAENSSEAGTTFIRTLYQHVMEMPQMQVDAIFRPMMSVLSPKYARGKLDKDAPDFWAARAAIDFPRKSSSFDRGIFSIYFLNLLHLRPGEGTFQPAGAPHAYLEGTNIELMSNSDNVLRGGLTPKHIDMPELLKTLSFKGGKPKILRGTRVSMNETVYETTADEFQLSKLQLSFSCPFQASEQRGPDALIVIEGKAEAVAGEQTQRLRKGDILFVKAGKSYALNTDISAVLYRATVPIK